MKLHQLKVGFKYTVLTGLIVIPFYVWSLHIPIISPYLKYPLFLVRCGGKPIIATDFAASYDYMTPQNRFYRVSPFVKDYFCSEQEAQQHYYHKTPIGEPR